MSSVDFVVALAVIQALPWTKFFFPARPVKISEDGFIFQEIPHDNHLFHVKETLDIEMFICMAVFKIVFPV